MAFDYQIGGQDVEVEPIDPHTEQQVKDLIDSGDYVAEYYPKRVIKDKDTDEEYAQYKFV